MIELTDTQKMELAIEFLSADEYFHYIRACRLMEMEWSMDMAIKQALGKLN